jgi:hypothetical protein
MCWRTSRSAAYRGKSRIVQFLQTRQLFACDKGCNNITNSGRVGLSWAAILDLPKTVGNCALYPILLNIDANLQMERQN